MSFIFFKFLRRTLFAIPFQTLASVESYIGEKPGFLVVIPLGPQNKIMYPENEQNFLVFLRNNGDRKAIFFKKLW